MLRAKIRVSGELPNFESILESVPPVDYRIERSQDSVLLDVVYKDSSLLNELLRRLKPKANRKGTVVNIESKEETLDQNYSIFRENLKLRNIGFKQKLLKRSYSYYVGINKILVVGNNLQVGKELYSYEGEDQEGRPVLILYLDGNPRNQSKEIEAVAYNTFLEKQSEMLKKVKKAKWRRQNSSKDTGE